MKRTLSRLTPKSKVWLELKGRPVFGDGKAQLLQAIGETGSIRGAADALGMSYRAAWGRLREMERRLGERLLVRQVGGRSGGGSGLTAFAQELLGRYAAFRRGVNDLVDRRFGKHFP